MRLGDGFQIYLHSFVVTEDGEWAVVQQGLNDNNGMARRYHWHSASVRDFVAEPHTAIVGENQGTIINLVDANAGRAQSAMLEMANEHPEKTLSEARHLRMPSHHEVHARDVDLKRLGAVLAIAYEKILKTSPICCSWKNLDHARFSRWPWLRKWSMARRAEQYVLFCNLLDSLVLLTQTEVEAVERRQRRVERHDPDRRRLDHLRAEAAQARGERARLRTGARNGDRAAVQWARIRASAKPSCSRATGPTSVIAGARIPAAAAR